MRLLVFTVSIFLLSLVGTYGLRLYALRVNLLDVPNARSSHASPTPRGGGIAIVVLVLAAAMAGPMLIGLPSIVPVSALLGLAGIAAIGYLDDHADVPALWRFTVHAVAAAFILYSVDGLPAVPWWRHAIDLGVAGAILGGVGLVWLTNLYNFMDGIDGIAATEALTVVLGGIGILYALGEVIPFELPVIAAAIAGFLVWNWPPARIFMGDAASGFLGALLGIIALVLSAQTGMTLWCWLILLAVFITDATFTLLRRLVRGERWYRPHRSHAYQRLSRRAARHWPVTVAVAVINLLFLTPLAWAAAEQPSLGLPLAVVAYAPLLVTAWRSGAGLPDSL